jgi:hypothetical protein
VYVSFTLTAAAFAFSCRCLFCIRCTGVEQGYVAVSEKGQVFVTGAPTGSIIARARPCPQNYYCPGGSPFDGGEGVPKPCPNGLRTQNEGAFSADQCGECVAVVGLSYCSECPQLGPDGLVSSVCVVFLLGAVFCTPTVTR